jgi:signal recognition particle subunit SRP54
MFDSLSRGFRQAKNRLAGLTELTEANIEPALREVRQSLLEADVELGVVKAFLARVKSAAVGETVQVRAKAADGRVLKVSAADQFTKICHDEMVAFMTSEGEALTFAPKGLTGIMMVGLQGSGKTTSCAKLAVYLKKQGKKVMLVAADMQRPAAVEQLQVLGERVGVPVFNIAGGNPVDICAKGREEARAKGCDVVIYDTAGRLAIDEALMAELASVQSATKPENVMLVVDAMIGQDAVKVSRGFHDKLGLTGVVLTKLDGDARGGAALSIREVTGAPVRFIGVGEHPDKFEEFRPEGMASRVLGMGDVVGLMKDFEQVIDEKKAAEDAARLLSGDFTLDDFLEQIRMIQKMGSLKDIVGKLPGMDSMLPADANLDDSELTRVEAMIQSFTKLERRDPNALVREPKRVARIAKGSGRTEKEVSELVQKFLFMKQLMGGFGQNLGMLGKIPGMKNLAAMKNMQKQLAQMGGMGGFPGMPGMGGFPGMPGMGGFPGMPGMGGFPGMPGMGGFPGMPGVGGDSLTKMKPLSQTQKNAKKAERQREKDARKRNRK